MNEKLFVPIVTVESPELKRLNEFVAEHPEALKEIPSLTFEELPKLTQARAAVIIVWEKVKGTDAEEYFRYLCEYANIELVEWSEGAGQERRER